MRKLFFLCLFISAFSIQAQTTYETKENISYYTKKQIKGDNYKAERCVLDIYYPTNKENFATVVWFHGGGLSGGEKFIPQLLKDKGIAVIGVNYRLHPKVEAPTYIKDAAAAVAWAFESIEDYGGDKSLIFVSGHSAGGYLASMIGLDKKYLKEFDIDANDIAGLIPFSGHTITHFTIRKERGIDGKTPIIDSLAPLFHVRKDAPPLLLITGDREKEMLGRYEENAYMMRMMKVIGHTETTLYEMDGYGHMMTHPAFPLLLKEIDRITKMKQK